MKEVKIMTMKSNETSAIKLKVVTDIDRGKESYAIVTFSGISAAVSDDNFMELANALASLQSYPVHTVSRINSCTLVTE
jgi:hypothetical protein